jgi:tRNA(fMet)-specific endonuclease VapC
MAVLLDAATLAAALKGRLPVILALGQLKPGDVAVSVVSQVQAETGLRLQPRALSRYGELMKNLLATVRVIEFGSVEAQKASQLAGYLAQQHESLSGFELILAATALAHGLTLITDEPQRYLSVPGLEVENWLRTTRSSAAA